MTYPCLHFADREEARREEDYNGSGDYDDDDDDDDGADWDNEAAWTEEAEETEDVKNESTAYLEFLDEEVSRLCLKRKGRYDYSLNIIFLGTKTSYGQ